MKRLLQFTCACVSAVTLFDVGQAAGKDVPYLTGRVTDVAQIVPAEVAGRITSKLEGLEKQTGAQVAVLTIPSLDQEALEEYSVRVAETWKLGRKGIDDGVLFLVVPGERKMRIEVGYGLESKLTDLNSRRILDDIVRPRFRAGDMGEGIEAGVDAIIGVIEDKKDALPPAGTKAASFSQLTVSGKLMVLAIWTLIGAFLVAVTTGIPGLIGWLLCLGFAYLCYTVGNQRLGEPWGIVVAAFWCIVFPILRIRRGRGSFTLISGGSGSGSSSSSFSSSTSSSSGFSGGGGSFGGGGSSSGW